MQKKGDFMLYKVLEIDDLIDSKADADREIIDLMENNNAHLKLVSLKKHQMLEPHVSHADTCLYVTDGEIEIIFTETDSCTCHTCGCDIPIEDEDGKKYKIKKGQLFFFEKDVMHSVKALKDSSFLLIKI